MPYAPGVDVVVVNWRTPDDLRGFIRSFVEVQFEVPCTLFVVNVEPLEEDAAAALEELDNVKVPVGYAVCPTNVGYAKACNMAGSAVRELGAPRQTVAFFNADTRLADGVLDHCHWNLHQNKDWGIIGPRQVDDDGLITHAGIFGTNDQPSFDGRWKQKDVGQFSEMRDDCVSVSGSAFFVKRECWDQLTECEIYQKIAPGAAGAFLPTPHAYEETFAAYHARFHNWKVVYDGEVSMIHKWHQASPVGGKTERILVPESRKIFRAACDGHGIDHD